MRVDAPVLERELFRLFESQPAWTFQQLQLETKQPTTHLKAVVEQVCWLCVLCVYLFETEMLFAFSLMLGLDSALSLLLHSRLLLRCFCRSRCCKSEAWARMLMC